MTTEMLGTLPTIADRKSDKAAATCQREALKRAGKLFGTVAAELNKAKVKAVKGSKKAEGVGSTGALSARLDEAIAGSKKVTKARAAVTKGVGKRCSGVSIASWFVCDGSSTSEELAACIERSAVGHACRMIETADALSLSCSE